LGSILLKNEHDNGRSKWMGEEMTAKTKQGVQRMDGRA
jgi:hypothetical protein